MQVQQIETQSPLQRSRLIYGCMRIAGDGSRDAQRHGMLALESAWDAGFHLFDHADIYSNGACERLFGEFLRTHDIPRKEVVITSKCGIRLPQNEQPGLYDSSSSHILNAVESSLRNARIDYLDCLLIHRPDYLMDPGTIASVFKTLADAGKVRQFGVSNFTPDQIELLQAALPFPLAAHQVEFNLDHMNPLDDGVLTQAMRRGMILQSWCPLGGVAYPAWHSDISEDARERLDREVKRQATQYGCEPTQISLAWLLYHPARIQPIIGSTNPERIQQSVQALAIPYTREDWYRILTARKGPLP